MCTHQASDRTDSGDDAGVSPAAVVHSSGRNPPGEGHHEVDPVWFEAAIPVAAPGANASIGDVVVSVSAISPDKRTMTLQIGRA